MKVKLSLSVEDALRLQRILHSTRTALSVLPCSYTWGIPGVSSISFDLSDVMLMEDVQIELLDQLNEENQPTHFAGCCNVF